ncbi:MAG: sugar phosphate isomerase/epimerase [Oscillospiraceae bacterium]|nr:sugar phosphate isomerase/epimerase [Oscillospiraceae bacterium]
MEKITIGACDWALPGGGMYAAQIASAVGLKALSLRIGLYENDYPVTHPEMQKIYLSEQQKYGIEYCSLALNDFDNFPFHARKGTKVYEIVWDLLKRVIPTARVLGIRIIQVPGAFASEIKTEEDLEYSTSAFQYLCDVAGEYEIGVASENLMVPDRFKTLFQMVGRNNFHLYFDTQNYHLFCGYKEVDVLEVLYPYICNQIHVKDGLREDGLTGLSGAPLGAGDAGFFETMSWLDAHNYSGYLLLENYYDRLPLRTHARSPYDLLREDIKTLNKAIKSPSSDS